MDSPRNILRTIKASKRILIPLHLRPDGDSVGSALACYHLLKGLGKRATVVSADPVPDIFLFLPGAKRIKVADPAGLDLSQFDLIFLTDNASPARFSRKGEIKLPPKTILVNIDHHESNHGFGNLNYVISSAAATAEVLYDLFKNWKINPTPEIANCLLTGIYTDTGGFLYPLTTSESLVKSADLMRRGADRAKITEQTFRSWTPKAITLWSEILAHAQIRKGVAYSFLPFSAVRKVHSQAELSGIRGFATSNLLLSIRGVRAAILFTEEKPRQVRATLRSLGNVNVSKIAERFGGGGHATSAGFDFRGTLKQAAAQTLKLVKVF